jgi:hypothetical protein
MEVRVPGTPYPKTRRQRCVSTCDYPKIEEKLRSTLLPPQSYPKDQGIELLARHLPKAGTHSVAHRMARA